IFTDLLFQNLVLQLGVARNRLAVDRGDHIEGSQLTFVGRRVGFDRAHDHALVDSFEQIPQGRIVAQSFDADAEPWPDNFLPGDKLGADLIDEVAWDGETEAPIEAIDECVHPDPFAVDVAKWSA